MLVVFSSLLAAVSLETAPACADDAGFDRTIAPLLAHRCLECHGESEKKGGLDLTSRKTALAGGDSGVVLAPGNLDGSLLWQRIRDDEMPPEEPLPDAEKKLLRAWIAGGAKWGAERIDPFRFTTDRRAGYDWWALQPLQRPALPNTGESDWPRGAIDRFVLAKLSDKNLRPSPPAGKRALIRRLSFDLLGLPPTPDDVSAFLADDAPGAYERLVDRLLASPRYGERWARHWLDVIRFGESQGFERDKLRTTSWRYRDWVVDSFNRDMPYEEFVRLQLAGDVLRPSDPEAIVATGFLVAGPFDEVGQNQQSAAMKAVVRQDELEDIVSTVGQTFLGLTVNCARCHDHKFDPIRQREYYQLTAALGGVRHGERDAINDETLARARRAARAVDARIARLRQRIEAIEGPVRESILAARQTRQQQIMPPAPIARWEFDGDLRDEVGELHGEAHGSAKTEGGLLVVDGKSYVATAPLKRDLTAKTLEAWVKVDNLQQRGGGLISVQSLDGKVFDAIVFGERKSGHWLAGSNNFARTQEFRGQQEQQANEQLVHVAIVYEEDGSISGYRNGAPYGETYKSSNAARFQAGEAQILFGLRHSPAGGNRYLQGVIDRAQLYDRALSAEEVAASAGAPSKHVSNKEIVAALNRPDRQTRENLLFEAEYLERRRDRMRETRVYAVAPRQPQTAHLLRRGNPADKGAVVTPGGVGSIVGIEADFALAADAPDGQRRTALADWITDPHNPLFARVIANRMWHYHFGAGLVATPNDLGFNGARPTHPQLLDWLAGEVLHSGGSLKSLHRAIVTSAVYRQASLGDDEAQRTDAGNRLLWRKTPLRLEAEAVRDAILSVSGQLNTAPGGPGFEDFSTYVRNTQFYNMIDPVGASFQRRSLYRTWVRSGRNPFLDVFDCPDPSTKTPRRAVTTTPLQALSLLNNSFVLRMSDRFAERVRRETDDDVDRQARRVFELAYSRGPSRQELQQSAAFVREHGLAALCRVVFNSNEFLYVD